MWSFFPNVWALTPFSQMYLLTSNFQKNKIQFFDALTLWQGFCWDTRKDRHIISSEITKKNRYKPLNHSSLFEQLISRLREPVMTVLEKIKRYRASGIKMSTGIKISIQSLSNSLRNSINLCFSTGLIYLKFLTTISKATFFAFVQWIKNCRCISFSKYSVILFSKIAHILSLTLAKTL